MTRKADAGAADAVAPNAGSRATGGAVAAPAEGSKTFHGFIRVDPKDPLYLSFTDDSFYYPVGLIVRSPSDDRMQYVYDFELKDDDLGTFAYDSQSQLVSQDGIDF